MDPYNSYDSSEHAKGGSGIPERNWVVRRARKVAADARGAIKLRMIFAGGLSTYGALAVAWNDFRIPLRLGPDIRLHDGAAWLALGAAVSLAMFIWPWKRGRLASPWSGFIWSGLFQLFLVAAVLVQAASEG